MTPEFISGACYFIVQIGLYAVAWWLLGVVDELRSELDLQRRTIRRLRRKVSEHDDLIDELELFKSQFDPTETIEPDDVYELGVGCCESDDDDDWLECDCDKQ